MLKFESIKRGDGPRFESTFILVKYIEGWFIWIHSDSWNVFQSLCSTLIISVEEMEPLPWRKDASAPVRLFHWLTLVLVVFFLTSNKGVLFPDFFLYLSPPYTVQQQLFLAEIKQRPQRQASNCSLYVRTTFPPVTDGLDWKTSHVWDTVTSAASAADLKLQMTSQRAAVHNLVRHCRRWQSTSGEIWQHYVQIMASTQLEPKQWINATQSISCHYREKQAEISKRQPCCFHHHRENTPSHERSGVIKSDVVTW